MDKSRLPEKVKYWLTASPEFDCFFLVGKKRIGAIRILLMGQSEPLREILKDIKTAAKEDICLPDVTPTTFNNFLKCVYGASESVVNNLAFEEALDLFFLVDKYLVKEVNPIIVKRIKKLLSASFDNVFIALLKPFCLFEDSIEKAVSAIVMDKTKELFADNRFLDIKSDVLLWILQHKSLNVSEINVWEAVMKWGKHSLTSSEPNDTLTLRVKLLDQLKFIRFRAMNLEEFCKKVVPTDILTPLEVCEICKSIGGGESVEMKHISNINAPRIQRDVKPVTSSINTNNNIKSEITYECNFNVKNARNKQASLGEFISQNFIWELSAIRNVGDFVIYLTCKGPFPILKQNGGCWTCQVYAEITLVNQSLTAPNHHCSLNSCFTNLRPTFGIDKFYLWGNLLNPTDGFIKNDEIIVRVSLKVISMQ